VTARAVLTARQCVAAAVVASGIGLIAVHTRAAEGQAPTAGSQAPTATPQAPAPAGQQPSFRASVDLVSLNVTVTDGARYVTDLQGENFSVFEDGVKQDITFFSRTNLPIALVMLLDTSASMELKLPVAQEAAIGFARRLRSQDLAEVIDFDSRVVVLQSFTSKANELEQAIRKTSAGGSTSMFNAIYIALKDLKKVVARNSEEIRRQAIVVLSDGEDTSSLLPFEEVLDLAKRSETSIYCIGLRADEASTGGTKAFNEAEFDLRQFAQQTGGRAFFPNQVSELNSIYTQISDELSSQYTVGYTSRNPRKDGGWRRVVVRVDRPNAVARTKLGYFAPTAPRS
jgi:Ca-activated chloride channel family protein